MSSKSVELLVLPCLSGLAALDPLSLLASFLRCTVSPMVFVLCVFTTALLHNKMLNFLYLDHMSPPYEPKCFD